MNETDETPEPSPENPAETPEKPARKRGGRPPGARNRATLERELRDARAELKKAREQVAADPFAAPVQEAAPAAAPTEAPAGEEPSPATVEETRGPAPSSTPVPVSDEETPPLGPDGARAMAPAYYGIINVGTRLLIKRAPAYKGKPEEARRVAEAVALDPRGFYRGEELVNASEDRQAIDPALIPVLAKMRLTPEWALVIITGGILLSKYALATGDSEVMEILGAMQPTEPQANDTTAADAA